VFPGGNGGRLGGLFDAEGDPQAGSGGHFDLDEGASGKKRAMAV